MCGIDCFDNHITLEFRVNRGATDRVWLASALPLVACPPEPFKAALTKRRGLWIPGPVRKAALEFGAEVGPNWPEIGLGRQLLKAALNEPFAGSWRTSRP